jgi:hypothetical protein
LKIYKYKSIIKNEERLIEQKPSLMILQRLKSTKRCLKEELDNLVGKPELSIEKKIEMAESSLAD